MEPRTNNGLRSSRPRFKRSDLWGDKKLFTSPRCQFNDDELFPKQEELQSHDDRWKYLSDQAGEHKQDYAVLDLTRRQITLPEVLRWGVPPQTAARVQELHLSLNETEDLLPEWLDVLSSMFFQLEHLHIFESHAPISPKTSEVLRMRRLYILYRLPGLKSIDSKAVTELERSLARPDTPNGHRVKRNEWLPQESLIDNLDDDDEDSSADENDNPDHVVMSRRKKHHRKSSKHGDVVEVSLHGSIKRVNADLPLTAWDSMDVERPKELKPRRHRRVVVPSHGDGNEPQIQLELKRPRRHPRVVASIHDEEDQQLLLEMESVVSPQHHWSAACGGLTFTYFGNDSKYRSSGLCGRPKIRLQFGRSKKDEECVSLSSPPERNETEKEAQPTK